jgi:hypothetical protein
LTIKAKLTRYLIVLTQPRRREKEEDGDLTVTVIEGKSWRCEENLIEASETVDSQEILHFIFGKYDFQLLSHSQIIHLTTVTPVPG